jgi:hypothetical protein
MGSDVPEQPVPWYTWNWRGLMSPVFAIIDACDHAISQQFAVRGSRNIDET